MRRLAILLLLGAALPAAAANSYSLTVTNALTFSPRNPIAFPNVPGDASVIATIFIVNPQRENLSLSVQALTPNLTSAAGDNIAVGTMSWSVSSATWVHSRPPQNQATFTIQPGAAVSTTAVKTVTGNDGRAQSTTDTVTGTVVQDFLFQNSWLYSTGAYAATLRWTLTTP